MGHLPLPASKGLGHQFPIPLPTPRDRIPQLEPARVIASLLETLAAAARPPDTILRRVTDAAQTLTGADGIALALRTDGVVICRARSGNLGPEIGDKVNASSGISGECLRTSKALRCDDTQTDDRVDPEVCRNTGIRSIVVVPLRAGDGTVGILEAFSVRAYAFGGEQMGLLKRLAEIAQAAYEAECGGKDPPALPDETLRRLPIPPDRFAPPALDVLRATVAASTQEHVSTEFPGERHWSARRYWIAGATVSLLLVGAVIWATWQGPDEDGSFPPPAQQPQSQLGEARSATAPMEMPRKPAAGRPGTGTSQWPRSQLQRSQDSAIPALRQAAEIESERGGSADPDRTVSGVATTAVAGQPDSLSQENSDPPLGVELSAAATPPSSETLSKLASAPTLLPDSEIPVSQGVIEATLVRKIQPIYPAEARSKRLEGSVILHLTIGEDGSTRDLKVVSGPPILVRAAAEAVRQWRYQPALLNGRPIMTEKQITVIFRAP